MSVCRGECVPMPLGTFSFVLHSHMPYVLSHGTWPHGEDWLYEAAAETYIPLLVTCERLISEGISPKITIGITPVLAEQLSDPRFRSGFPRYLARMRAAATHDAAEFAKAGEGALAALAAKWRESYAEVEARFTDWYRCDIVAAFALLQAGGHIEILTSSATHGYSPLLATDESLQQQVSGGIEAHIRHFGQRPKGYWLPECAYRPAGMWTAPEKARGSDGSAVYRIGVDEVLAHYGIEYFFAEGRSNGFDALASSHPSRIDALVDTWATTIGGNSPISTSPYRAYEVLSPSAATYPICVLFRDPATGVQVWSGDSGYPAGAWYLDFHKRRASVAGNGFRYWRVTGLDAKAVYDPLAANEQVRLDSAHFATLVANTLRTEAPDGAGIVCATYDTELFGHWWHEGGEFLYEAIRAIAAMPDIARATCSEYIDAQHSGRSRIALTEGSWGAGGGHAVWLNDQARWIWDVIYAAELRMQALRVQTGVPARLMRQAERELLLMLASDWPFLISTHGAEDYAAARVRQHATDFNAIAFVAERCASGGAPTAGEWKMLAECEQRDRLFL